MLLRLCLPSKACCAAPSGSARLPRRAQAWPWRGDGTCCARGRRAQERTARRLICLQYNVRGCARRLQHRGTAVSELWGAVGLRADRFLSVFYFACCRPRKRRLRQGVCFRSFVRSLPNCRCLTRISRRPSPRAAALSTRDDHAKMYSHPHPHQSTSSCKTRTGHRAAHRSARRSLLDCKVRSTPHLAYTPAADGIYKIHAYTHDERVLPALPPMVADG